MLRLGFAVITLLSLFSCNKKNTSETGEAEQVGKFYVPTYAVQKFEGTYNGSFDDGFLTLVINHVSGKTVSGYNLHKGLRRNVNGSLTEANGQFNFELKEPGDNPFDGTFTFTVDTTTFKLSGWWKPFDSSKTTAKQLSLTRKVLDSSSIDNYLGNWVPATGTYATDTILEFDPQGTCAYNFYEKPGDSTSQMVTVKGNYVQNRDTVIIEWQKNTYTPEQKMKLVIRHKMIKQDDYEYDQPIMQGHGWKLNQFSGD